MRILKFINHFEFSNHFVTSLCFNSDVLRVPAKALSRERSHGVIMQGTCFTQKVCGQEVPEAVSPPGAALTPATSSRSVSDHAALIQLHPALCSDYT